MNRRERRQAEKAARRGGSAGNVRGQVPLQGQLRQPMTPFAPEDEARHRQDFLAGTVFAEGAGIAFPEGGSGPADISSMFTVFVHEDERTFGPAPQLREAFRLLDEHGAVKLHQDVLTVGTAWSGLGGEQTLVKLKLEFHQPIRGDVGIVLLADQYANLWHHIAGGGMIALTSQERMERAINKPGASFADGMEASILLAIHASPVLEQFITAYDWPRS